MVFALAVIGGDTFRGVGLDSRWLWAEPFGLIGLEAMWLSRPVIASRVGGVTDWLEDGVTGRLVTPNRPAALAHAADEVAADPELARRWGAAGKERARRLFGADGFIERLLEIYNNIRLVR